LAEELLEEYHPVIQSIGLIPSKGGVFEVKLGEELIYSKKATGRHATPQEVATAFSAKTGTKALSNK
jgi:selenoprotein W-related protein